MSPAGGSGVGGGAQFHVVDGARIQLPDGVQVDLSTAEGVRTAEAALNAGQLAELQGLMSSLGFQRVGGTFVPRDSYELRQQLGVVGPGSTSEGLSDTDQAIITNVFVKNGIPSPYNANTTERLYSEIHATVPFKAAVGAMNEFLVNPTPGNSQNFVGQMAALQAANPNGNIMEVLFLVFRQSIESTNEDKKYFLLKLQEFNKMAEQISDYLNYLVERSQALSQAAEGQKYPEKVHIDVEVKTFDLSALGPDGKLAVLTDEHKSLDRMPLTDTMKSVESAQETIRNKRQTASTAFQNFDQKANQLYNLMASVLKSVNEMRSGTIRNML